MFSKRTVLFVFGMALLAAVAGCDPRTTNQGGGSLISAGLKLADHNIGDLTADEWQILVDNAPTLAQQFNVDLGDLEIPTLSDDQAAAIVSFLDEHGIKTIEQFEEKVDSGEITEADIPEELLSLIPV